VEPPVTGYALGLVLAFGLLVAIDGATRRRRPERSRPRRSPAEVLATASTRTLLATAGGIVAATAAFAFTHWIALTLVAAAVGAMAPGSIVNARAARRRLARQEALAQVADRLRNAVRSGRDLPEAIVMAAESAPPALQDEMNTLKNLVRRRGVQEALDTLAEASEDSFVRQFARTLAGAYQSGARLASLLAAIADASWLQTRTARDIRTRQTSIRLAANLVSVLPVLTMVYLKGANPAFLRPYSTAFGQGVMLVGFGFVAAGWWIARSLGGLKA
jgi:tight adherence protein B